MSDKKLKRSENKKIFGVCGGLAEYFNLDVVVLRILWLVLTVVTGCAPGIIVYLVMALVMPKD